MLRNFNPQASCEARRFVDANYKNGKRKYKKHHPYSLGIDGEEALEASRSNDEEMIKAIVLRFQLYHKDIDLDIDLFEQRNFFCKYHLAKKQ